MNKDLLNELLADPKKLESISLESLEDLAIEFPYFTVIQKLINTKKRQIDKIGKSAYSFVNLSNRNEAENAINNNFSKEEEEEFIDLEVKEKDLPFENIEDAKTEETKFEQPKNIETLKNEAIKVELPQNNGALKNEKIELEQAENIEVSKNEAVKLEQPETISKIKIVNKDEIANLQSLSGTSNFYFEDDLNLLPNLPTNVIANLENANITAYQQLINIKERDGTSVLVKTFNLLKPNVEAIFAEAKILFHNKYQKLLIERLGFSNYASRNNLKQIVGIGETLENKLNQTGIYTFQQLTGLNEKFIEILTALIDYFPGRIERDNWVIQAQKLSTVNSLALPQKKINETIEHLAEKLKAHTKFKTASESKEATDTEKDKENTRTFLDWLDVLNGKKDKLATNKNKHNEEPLLEKVDEIQPRLVKVDEDNLKEIHGFLGNNAKDYQSAKPVFEFLPGFSVKEVAAKSLDEDKNIVSVTLAKIYEQQLYFDKAISIYQKLILKYPEKSGFFASRIEVLKEKI